MTYRTVDMTCPECGIALVQYEGREKWRCGTCGGALCGAEELELDLPAPPPALAEPRGCPHCKQPMFAFKVGDLVLDRCAKDRLIWFDRGELGKLRAALADPVEDWAVRMAAFVRFGL